MIRENLSKISQEISKGNNLGEKIVLVGATKFVSIDLINDAIDLGLEHIGENHAQELRDKFSFYKPVYKHFIGRLQRNKLKYIVGKADCIDSVDSIEIATEIANMSQKLAITSDIMLEVNSGDNNKTGFDFQEIFSAYEKIKALNGVRVVGMMAMLPISDNEEVLAEKCKDLRNIFDRLKIDDSNIKYLSVGMSSDYKIAIANGSNMIRLGTAIFGQRNYEVK